MVGMPSFPMGRVPDYYGQDAAEFVPERWLKGAGGNEGKQAAEGGGLADVFAFGIGPRDCIGRALAMLELQVVLATLVGCFAFALPPGVKGEGVAALEAMVCYHITLHPRDGLKLCATPRAPLTA
ncbi:cytochrome P450 [Monoraphidium neglectum]|uniref:Cytochrome P450 n=1 Tax=Monoraphidium neglectum TaxID=145388 RepID=A0A0D2MV00_9CHLO|nr:cytochrome P450 [Monoraphidium neglectum]KIY98165.1 cytochrome P450 [Monoraphidium neglectum]|eukprot:XP_013897185.1 cytochrome P450 [Monoraphidium neglectum]